MFQPKWDDKELQKIVNGTWKFQTPYYYLDEDRFRANIGCLRERLHTSVKICYSVKANPWYASAGKECADYLEVCSWGEVELCRRQNIPFERLVAGGVCKSRQELEQMAVNPFHRISVESVRQLALLSEAALHNGTLPQVLLRITSGNQFGMTLDTAVDIFENRKNYPNIQFQGIHYYSGTQKKRQQDIVKDMDFLADVVDRCGEAFTEIEYGPGLGVPQFPSQSGEEYEACMIELARGLTKFADRYRIVIESGRLLTADTGIYVTEIMDIKDQGKNKFYVLDGGAHHLQYFGQACGVPSPYICAPQSSRNRKENVTLCGALCTVNDIMAKNISLDQGEVGQKLCFLNAGAYAVTEGISLFLSRDLPAVVRKRKGKCMTAKRNVSTYLLNMEREGEI